MSNTEQCVTAFLIAFILGGGPGALFSLISMGCEDLHDYVVGKFRKPDPPIERTGGCMITMGIPHFKCGYAIGETPVKPTDVENNQHP